MTEGKINKDDRLFRVIRERMASAIDAVYYDFLVAANRTGDDLYVYDDIENATDKLAECLVFMIENNPKEK